MTNPSTPELIDLRDQAKETWRTTERIYMRLRHTDHHQSWAAAYEASGALGMLLVHLTADLSDRAQGTVTAPGGVTPGDVARHLLRTRLGTVTDPAEEHAVLRWALDAVGHEFPQQALYEAGLARPGDHP